MIKQCHNKKNGGNFYNLLVVSAASLSLSPAIYRMFIMVRRAARLRIEPNRTTLKYLTVNTEHNYYGRPTTDFNTVLRVGRMWTCSFRSWSLLRDRFVVDSFDLSAANCDSEWCGIVVVGTETFKMVCTYYLPPNYQRFVDNIKSNCKSRSPRGSHSNETITDYRSRDPREIAPSSVVFINQENGLPVDRIITRSKPPRRTYRFFVEHSRTTWVTQVSNRLIDTHHLKLKQVVFCSLFRKPFHRIIIGWYSW